MTIVDTPATTAEPAGPSFWSRVIRLATRKQTLLLYSLIGITSMSMARIISGNDDLTSAGTFGVMLRTATPIALCGLGGLWAERSGTVNIGLEGMMIMGTIFAGWWGWEYGPWAALAGGIVGGMLFGLLHGIATVTFGVNHIVSGFAINIMAPGLARFMANQLFTDAPGGSVTNSPGVDGAMGKFTMPFLSGGEFLGMSTPNPLKWIEDQGWFILSDLAGLFRGLTTAVSYDVIVAILMFVASAYIIWRTPFGLRLRSAGERPSAADSLGVSVYLTRYYGVVISGAMAGLGGAVLVLFSNRYQEGQTGGRGFLGLATLIVGNWRPAGVGAGALLFGYFQGITLRVQPEKLVRAVVLAAAIALVMAAGVAIWRRRWSMVPWSLALAAAGFLAYTMAERPNNQLVFITPYLVTLIVVSVGGQRLRPPAQEGIPWRKGSQL
jgi:general nucleoside transport system permease protein